MDYCDRGVFNRDRNGDNQYQALNIKVFCSTIHMFVNVFWKTGCRAVIQGFQKTLRDHALPGNVMVIYDHDIREYDIRYMMIEQQIPFPDRNLRGEGI